MTDPSHWRAYEDIYGKKNTVEGRVVVWPRLASTQLGGERDIVAYLPPSLASAWPNGAASRRYPVLYFNDGQNVFDAKTAYVGEEWKADETLEALAAEGIEAIAVAIPNGLKTRMDEYNPWRSTIPWRGPLPSWAESREMGGKGDAYLDWVIETVKPLIDRSFPTATEPAQTAMVGSSMGGLISLYAIVARPDAFALSGAFSPSLPWSNYRILEMARERLGSGVRLYVDVGIKEGRGMTRDARRLHRLLHELGFAEGGNLMYVEDRQGTHHESAWARRLPDALRFLLRPTDQAAELPST